MAAAAPKVWVYAIHCLNSACQDRKVRIFLPLQSPLGKFDGPSGQPTDSWPINLLCHRCKSLSIVPEKSIQRFPLEKPNHELFVRYDFSSAQSGTLKTLAIYSRENKHGVGSRAILRQDGKLAIEHILKPSGLWEEAYGDQIWVSIDLSGLIQAPMKLKPSQNTFLCF